MKKSIMKKYASTVVKIGANVKKGQYVIITASVNQSEFIKYLVEECYKAKARYVKVNFFSDDISRLSYQNVKYDTYIENSKLREPELESYSKILPVNIYVEDSDPDIYNGIDMSESLKARQERYPVLKKYYDAMDNKYQWVICALPSIA